MGDYPDYTSLMQIMGTDITLPIDIKAVTVAHIDVDLVAQTIGNIAVNIAASAITLNVAIASSAVTLNVAIASSAVTLNVAIQSSAVTINVDVKAQTLTDFKITVNAQNVGVYLQPEWAAKTGIDKNFIGTIDSIASGSSFNTDYNVPAGKTLYITHASFVIYSTSVGTALTGFLILRDNTAAIDRFYLGGSAGFGLSFSKAIVFPSGSTFRIIGWNRGGYTCFMAVTAGGYEL